MYLVERLESRCLLATFVVNSATGLAVGDNFRTSDFDPGDGIADVGREVDDDGDGVADRIVAANVTTLTAAIQEANAGPGLDRIHFNIDGGGAHRLQDLKSGFGGFATDSVIIDGSTQPGYVGVPLIELDGTESASGSVGIGIEADNSVLRGLAIHGFATQISVNGNNNLVVGNFVGTTRDGAAVFLRPGSQFAGATGVSVNGQNSRLGGTEARDRNIISGFSIAVKIFGTGHHVVNNFIGTDVTGQSPLFNASGVVVFVGQGNHIIESNVIAAATGAGLQLNSAGNTVRNNKIGTDVGGMHDLGNGGFGVSDLGGGNTLTGNLISGNTAGGVSLNPPFEGSVLESNRIGTSEDGIAPLGNDGPGVWYNGVPFGNLRVRIGGDQPGQGNTIAFNGGAGIAAGLNSQNGHTILGNSVHSNGGLGIDLYLAIGGDDPGDGRAADYGVVTPPKITAVRPVAGGTEVDVSYQNNSFSPRPTIRVEFFTNDRLEASGDAEGQTFLGAREVAVDASGHAGLTATFPGTVQFVTATATDDRGFTSEFSQVPQPIVVNSTGDESDADPNDGVADVNLGMPGSQTTLRSAIEEANRRAGPDTITFAIAQLSTISPATALPTIADPVIIDASTHPGGPVQLNGDDRNFPGLKVTNNATTIRGLAISHFGGHGIDAMTDLFAEDTAIQSNGGNGIHVESGVLTLKHATLNENQGDGVHIIAGFMNIKGSEVTKLNGNFGNGVDIGFPIAGSNLTGFGSEAPLEISDNRKIGILSRVLINLKGPTQINRNRERGVLLFPTDAAAASFDASQALSIEVIGNGAENPFNVDGQFVGAGIEVNSGTVKLNNATVTGNFGDGVHIGQGFMTITGAQGTRISDNFGDGVDIGGPIPPGSAAGFSADGPLEISDNREVGVLSRGQILLRGPTQINRNRQRGVLLFPTQAAAASFDASQAASIEVIGNGFENPFNLDGQFVGDGIDVNTGIVKLNNATVTGNAGVGIHVGSGSATITGDQGNRVSENRADGIEIIQGDLGATNLSVLSNRRDGIDVTGNVSIHVGHVCGNFQENIRATGNVILEDVVTGSDCDQDEDHVDSLIEDAAPNGGDGNNDGTLDSEQANVTSLPNVRGDFVTLVAPTGLTFSGVQALDNSSPNQTPVGVQFPQGFFRFDLAGLAPGGSATMDLTFPAGTVINDYFKFGPEPGNLTPHFYRFNFDGTTGAELLDEGRRVRLHLVDGGRGDSDLAANGIIVDPGAPAASPADLIVTNGIVYTVDAANPIAEAVAARDGRIVFVGDAATAASFIGPETEVIDAEGAVVLPGFVDAHTHPLFLAEAFGIGVAALDAETIADLRATVLAFAAANPGFPVVRALPWKYDFRPDGSLPTAAEMDQLFPELVDRPLIVQTQGGQEYLLNSKALTEMQARNMAAFLRLAPTRDQAGNFTGVLEQGFPTFEFDFWTFAEYPGGKDALVGRMQDVFLEVVRLASSSGITTIDDHAATSGVKPAQHPASDHFGNIELALRARDTGQLDNMRLRANLHIHQDDFLDPANAAALDQELTDWITRGGQLSDNRFRFGESAKLYIEGVGERHTAAFHEPYSDLPTSFGETFYPTDSADPSQPGFAQSTAFFDTVKQLDDRGLQVATHATGDRGSRIVINAYEQVQLANGPRDRRQRIEHNEYATVDGDVQRLADLGIFSVLTAAGHVGSATTDAAVGLDRAARFAPARSLIDAGAPVAFVSDFSVTPFAPLIQAFVAQTRIHHDGTILGLDQAITLPEYILGATLGGATAMFQEANRGSIEVGKVADLVIFNPEPFAFQAGAIGFAPGIVASPRGRANLAPNPRVDDFIADYPHVEGAVDIESLLDDIAAGVAARLLNPNRTTIVAGRVVYSDSAPVPQDDAVTALANEPLQLDLVANDADADEFPTLGARHRDLLFVSSVTQPAHGAVVNLEGSVVYIPEPGFVGTDMFTYRNHDGAFESAVEAVVTVTVRSNGVAVAGLELTPSRRGIASVRVNFSDALDPASARDPDHYEIRSVPARARGRVGPVIPVASAAYDPATNQVTLRPRGRLPRNTRFQITIRDAITDLAGQPIDGDSDGQPGGNHVVSAGLFRRVSYTDRDGDTVDLAIETILQDEQDRGPGRAARAKRPAGLMELIWSVDGEGHSLRLVGTTPREHVLRGRVLPAVGSDRKTTFQSTTGLANVIHQLPVCSPVVVDACFELGVVGAIA
jgi:hypothetical protein